MQRVIDETRQLLVRLVGDRNRYKMLLEGLILQVASNACIILSHLFYTCSVLISVFSVCFPYSALTLWVGCIGATPSTTLWESVEMARPNEPKPEAQNGQTAKLE